MDCSGVDDAHIEVNRTRNMGCPVDWTHVGILARRHAGLIPGSYL